jgi:hypothetical protein
MEEYIYIHIKLCKRKKQGGGGIKRQTNKLPGLSEAIRSLHSAAEFECSDLHP